jgi:glycosyltransferase involved in cell wall biosynthesis
MTDLPMVSALMAAYNYEEFVGRAIESALQQDYPPDRLEVVVIDDGSTDSTAEIVKGLSARHPGRVRLIQQPNSGYVAATNRALGEAHGEMLALLDADDMWLPGKTRRQVEMLLQRPELGMAFSDMKVVDSDEQMVHPSLTWRIGDLPDRAFARVLHENVATQSSIMIRASMRERVHPIPPEIPYADWWITLRCAEFSQIDYSREPLALYRVHGSNLTGNVAGPAAVREARKSIAFQLWVLRNLPLEEISPDQMEFVWAGVEAQAQKAVQAAQSFFVELAEGSAENRTRAQELLVEAERLRAAGDPAAEAAATLRALAHDPFQVGLREQLLDAAARAAAAATARAAAAATFPDPLGAASGFIALADAEDLLSDDALLSAYAGAVAGIEGITLAIDATRLSAQSAAQELQALVARCGLADRDDIAMVAVVGQRSEAERQQMLRRAHARYRGEAGEDNEIPVFTPASLGQLTELARRSGARG